MRSQGRTAAFLEQSSKTLNCISFPPGCRLQDVFRVWCDLGPGVLFVPLLSSPRVDFLLLLLFVLFLVSCFLFPPCVLAGTHFCGCWPKGMFGSCQERRRLGLANPRMNGAPSSPFLVTVLRSQEELPRPASAFPSHVS